MKLELEVGRNGTTTSYAYNYVAYRTDFTFDEYWTAQRGRPTLDDLPDDREDPTILFPHERTWVNLQAGDVVTATFRVDTADSLRGPIGGVYSGYVTIRIGLQEMGKDLSPGGNGEDADHLLMWLATHSRVFDKGELILDGTRIIEQWRDLDLTYRTLAPPLGLQVVLDPKVQVVHPNWVFTSFDKKASGDESALSRQEWPDAQHLYFRPRYGLMPNGDVIFPPDATEPAVVPLQFRFTIEAGKMYRMFAITRTERPGCTTGDAHGWKSGRVAATFSQLAFGNPTPTGLKPGLDLIMERGGPDQVAVGAQASYTIIVKNKHDATITSTATILTETIPSGLTFLGAECAGCKTFEERTVGGSGGIRSWTIGDISPGESITVTVRVRAEPTAPDRATMHAVTMPPPPQEDRNPKDNEGERTMTVLRGNVRAAITAPKLTRPGEEFEIRVRAINTTPGVPAFLRSMTLTLPYGVTLIDAGGGDVDGSSIVWTYVGNQQRIDTERAHVVVRKTQIPARGLQAISPLRTSNRLWRSEKNPNPRQGIASNPMRVPR